jgi:hypothetical protein
MIEAWAAGFIDGEGHLGLYRTGGATSPYPTLRADQAKRKPLDQLQELFGGRVYPYKGDPIRYHRWILAGTQNVFSALTVMRPYLFVKDNEADVILEYCDHVLSRKGSSKALSQEEIEIRNGLVEKLRSLRGRGLTVGYGK